MCYSTLDVYPGATGATGPSGFKGMRGPFGPTGATGATGLHVQEMRRVKRLVQGGCPGQLSYYCSRGRHGPICLYHSVCQGLGSVVKKRPINYSQRCFAARCYANAAYAVMRCLSVRSSVRPSVCHVRGVWQTTKYIFKNFHRRVAKPF